MHLEFVLVFFININFIVIINTIIMGKWKVIMLILLIAKAISCEFVTIKLLRVAFSQRPKVPEL